MQFIMVVAALIGAVHSAAPECPEKLFKYCAKFLDRECTTFAEEFSNDTAKQIILADTLNSVLEPFNDWGECVEIPNPDDFGA